MTFSSASPSSHITSSIGRLIHPQALVPSISPTSGASLSSILRQSAASPTISPKSGPQDPKRSALQNAHLNIESSSTAATRIKQYLQSSSIKVSNKRRPPPRNQDIITTSRSQASTSMQASSQHLASQQAGTWTSQPPIQPSRAPCGSFVNTKKKSTDISVCASVV
ncbi:hypothetical protein PSEUBRA_002696 [Kalmanozyma brasiliensis GHG001]|uniref:uncharacterized protein n=1 Tax=Kalmanozyma brasiliensis (strain GHG001) TaxID=1365824 RepID=UPI0028682B48|nr:uncharacterized protein PSEUBRA_002696 [Kalmanozyma brasiliensis GHG001]KAF6767117.1 hypothetical protein PSEUBRA_002696 [Kalmanozyma brasiliensis GHG001]